jgi:hypothetical protein
MPRTNAHIEVMREIFEKDLTEDPAGLCVAAGLTGEHANLLLEVLADERNKAISSGS